MNFTIFEVFEIFIDIIYLFENRKQYLQYTKIEY